MTFCPDGAPCGYRCETECLAAHFCFATRWQRLGGLERGEFAPADPEELARLRRSIRECS